MKAAPQFPRLIQRLNMKKKVVVMGGGNGSAKSIRACKVCIDKIELSAVISVSDSGGSSGVLRKEFGVLPPGDLLRAIMAMSVHDYDLLKSIFYSPRFEGQGKFDTHNIGNLFLALGSKYDGDSIHAIRALEQGLNAEGHVYPVTLEQTGLVAELEDGSVVSGEHAIDRPTGTRKRIKRVYLEPSGVVYNEAARVIREADYILFGPGSLYCSVVASILPRGCREALADSKAEFVYIVGNAYEAHGEVGPTKLSDFVRELEQYLPRKIDVVVYNNRVLNEQQKEWYKEKQWKLFDADLDKMSGHEVIQGDFERDERPGLDDVKLGQLLKQFCDR